MEFKTWQLETLVDIVGKIAQAKKDFEGFSNPKDKETRKKLEDRYTGLRIWLGDTLIRYISESRKTK